MVGFPAGIPRLPLNLTLLKRCDVCGVFWGAFTRTEPENNRRNNEELLNMYLDGKVKPHIHAVYPQRHQMASRVRAFVDFVALSLAQKAA